MGRRKQTAEPIPVSFIAEAFHVRQDGALCWRERPRSHFPARLDDAARFNNQRAGEPAGFRGPNGRPLVRFVYNGRTRRVAMLKAAWIVATGELPHGAVLPRDGDQWNASFENLIEVRHGRDPFGALTNKHSKGGKASALVERRARITRLIDALSAHPGSTVPQLSRLVGSSSPCTCVRLSKLADMGLCIGPKCDSRARWDLSPAGRAAATRTGDHVVLLDDLDRQVLAALALTAMGTVKLARRVEVCPMTIRRRVRSLVENGLVFADPRRFYVVTDQGRRALGDDMPQREPWLKVAAISAALAKDVVERSGRRSLDDRTSAMRSQQGTLARQKAIETERKKKTTRSTFTEFDRMTG